MSSSGSVTSASSSSSTQEIRLPYDLLNDVRFRRLADASKAHLICLLLLSARMDNLLAQQAR